MPRPNPDLLEPAIERVLSTCVCCGSTRLARVREYACSDPRFVAALRQAPAVLRCASCGLAQVDHAHLDAAAFDAWRAGEQGERRAPRTRAAWRWLEARSRVLAELSRRHHDGGRVDRVFQIGAGPGLDLVALQRVHPEAECWVDRLESDVGWRSLARVGSLADGPFDRVLITHELGRVVDPVGSVRRAIASLRTGGLLIVEVANDLDGFLDRRVAFEPQLTFFTVHTLHKFFATNFGDELRELHLATAGPRVDDGAEQRPRSWLERLLGRTPGPTVDASDDPDADDRALARIVLRRLRSAWDTAS